jgi:hypothetical protein
MRTRFLILSASVGLLAVGANIAARADYKAIVLGDNPAGYWQFEETAFVTIPPDLATNLGSLKPADYGNYSGGVIKGVPGAVAGNTAASFSGGNSVSVPYDASLNPSVPFSVEFWIKPNTLAFTCPISSTDFDPTPRLGWLFYTDPNVNGYANFGYYFRVYSSTGTKAVASAAGVLTTNWTHVVGVVDETSVLIYVNGQLSGTAAWSGTLTPVTSKPLTLGVRYDAGFPLDGSMDEVAVYGTALSANTIKAHYDAATNNAAGYASELLLANPLGYWRLGEPAPAYPVAVNAGSLGASVNGSYKYWSTTATDLVGPTFPGFAVINRVLETSGTNGIVTIPPLNLNASAVTMECWIKPNGAQADYAGVFFHRGGGSTATGIDYKGSTGQIGYHWSDQGDTYGWDSGLYPQDGAWNYVALAVTPDKATMYLHDGISWHSSANYVSHPPQPFAETTRVGADQDAARFFTGRIDEAAIYGKTLTEGQLHTHALAGMGDPAHNPPAFVSDPPVLSPSGTIYTTTPFTITADVYGEPPLTFQWQHEGTNLPGATTVSFTRTSATPSDAGNYVVVVGNANGNVTSSPVSVAVNPAVPPTITSQPLTRLVYAGGTAQFTVVADGTTPFSYQWKHAGTNLPGATNATLVVPNCTAVQAGSYGVGVTNVAGGVLSSSATLTLINPVAGSFEEKVVTNAPVAYWRLGETSGTVAYDYVGGNDGTYYNVAQGQPGATLGDPNGSAGFDGASSYVGTGRGLLNNRAQFTVMGWLKRGAIHSTRGGYFGQNNLLEFGDANTGTSVEAWIDVTAGNIIVPWPWPDDQWGFIVLTGDGTANRLYIDGQLAGTRNSSVSSYGTNQFNFNIGGGGIFNDTGDWFNGYIDEVALYAKPLSDATIADLYSSGLYGRTTPPFVTRNPAGATVVAGSTVSLSGAMNGSQPITYQWKKNGMNVAGATAATLTLNNVYFTDAGNYVLWATNGAGYGNSAAAALAVMPPPTFANATNGLVLHLRFDGDYLDTSGRANDASAVGNPPFLTGRIGQGVHVETTPGNNYLVVLDPNEDMLFDETVSFTVGFWIKYTTGFNDVPIIGNCVNSTWQIGWVFTDSADVGKIEYSLASTANNGTYLRDPVPGCPTINDGTWHLVIGVVDRAAQTASVYVDGALAGSWSITGLGSLASGYALTIGQDPTGNYGSTTFDMDDLGIWRRALTAFEAAGVYGAAQQGNSFDVYGPVRVYVNQVGSNIDVSWQAGTLLQSSTLNGQYLPVSGATAPFYRTTATGSAMFFRVQQ